MYNVSVVNGQTLIISMKHYLNILVQFTFFLFAFLRIHVLNNKYNQLNIIRWISFCMYLFLPILAS